MFLWTDKALFKVDSPAFALSSETLGEMFHFSLRLSVLCWFADRVFGSGTWNFPFAHLCCIVPGGGHSWYFYGELKEYWSLTQTSISKLLISQKVLLPFSPLLPSQCRCPRQGLLFTVRQRMCLIILRFQSYFNREKGSKFCHCLLTYCIAVTPFKNMLCYF